jgi:hypothetical protein
MRLRKQFWYDIITAETQTESVPLHEEIESGQLHDTNETESGSLHDTNRIRSIIIIT